MNIFLQKHGPGVANHRIKVSGKRNGNSFRLAFEVQKRNQDLWHTDDAFTADYKSNWGLWNKDVVEAFLQLRSDVDDLKAPYLEVQVSPLNQPFALIITEPRKTFFAPDNLDIKTESKIDGKIWTGSIEVTFPKEIKGEYLFGGFFSCLQIEPREYFAILPNPEERPDFHRPEFFVPLDLE